MKRIKLLFVAVITIFIATVTVNAKEVTVKRYNYVYSDTTIADFNKILLF